MNGSDTCSNCFRASTYPELQQVTVWDHFTEPIEISILIAREESCLSADHSLEVKLSWLCDGEREWNEQRISATEFEATNDYTYRSLKLFKIAIHAKPESSLVFDVAIRQDEGAWLSSAQAVSLYPEHDLGYSPQSLGPWRVSQPTLPHGKVIAAVQDLSRLTYDEIFREESRGEVDVKPRQLGGLANKVWIAAAKSVDAGTVLGTPQGLEQFWLLSHISSPWRETPGKGVAGTWLGPYHGLSELTTVDNVFVLCAQRSDGTHVLFMPVWTAGHACLCSFSISTSGVLSMQHCGQHPDRASRCLVSVGTELGSLLDTSVKLIRAEFTNPQDGYTNGVVSSSNSAARPSRSKVSTSKTWMSGVGFCTWDAWGFNVSEAKILAELNRLQAAGVEVSSLIIDDGWQAFAQADQLVYSKTKGASSKIGQQLLRFEANSAFPTGLRSTINKIRQEHPYIEDIVIWHPLHGYWGGISPNGPLANRYRCVDTMMARNFPWALKRPLIAPDDIERFYHDLYSFLYQSGVTGIKIDQCVASHQLEGLDIQRSFVNSYGAAVKGNAELYFQGHAIYSMAHIPSLLLALTQDTPQDVDAFRNSHDYYPTFPGSNLWHIYMNSMNAVFFSRLDTMLDFDMFESKDRSQKDRSSAQAVFRCLSGGPVMFSDKDGDHDFDVLHRLTAKSPTGQSVVIRPAHALQAENPYVSFSTATKTLFKVINRFANGATVMGVFNLSTISISSLIPIDRFAGLSPHLDQFVIFSHKVQSVVAVELGDKKGLANSTRSEHQQNSPHAKTHRTLPLSLRTTQWDILTACRLDTEILEDSGQRVSIAVLGLLKVYTGCGAVVASSFHNKDKGHIKITLMALGVLAIYISDLEQRTNQTFGLRIEDQIVAESGFHLDVDTRMLTVDVAEAWAAVSDRCERSTDVVNLTVLFG